MIPPELRTVNVTRYVTPLREGGSLPAIVDGDDDFPYVLKFRGAGQGRKALIAELIGGELARGLGLRVPELVFMELDDSFSKTEPDEEIQDLLKFSVGLNLGLHYLAGAITYDPLVSVATPLEASLVVLLDAVITNIDRTVRNPNLLNWKKELWLIDHGASLYFHHAWTDWEAHAHRPFPAIKDHVLLPKATELPAAAAQLRSRLTPDFVATVVELLPDDWLVDAGNPQLPAAKRQVYTQYLTIRLAQLDALTKAAENAR
ncbi:aminotransferase class I and II [Neolewinella lacunae]|uniref:Aminotransferase class I and II n=1 Tax=Neolewinella lacunae TaxID=1517758 RepID=A0A923T9V5_9BACT|nr:HipA family kinase [Neolewinella lacunae]MBC6995473.1 aminotransferase class I and II [Neolewinella lacunae]MDN3635061.1 aminotransferase class I and II [Neolewinella lacunae]